MDSGTLSGVMTAILIVVFLGIVAWAYSSRRRRDFDEAAQLPLDEHDRASGNDPGDDDRGDNE